jgi:hypothetical protein
MTSWVSLLETNESEESTAMKIPMFAHFIPCKTEYIELFSVYPRSHINRYISIVELSSSIVNVKAITKLCNALQYSLTGEGGKRLKAVDFFATNKEKEVMMNHHYRQCATVKVCKFILDELKKPYFEVDHKDLKWVRLLAAQKQAKGATYTGEITAIYKQCVNLKYNKYEILEGQCGGKTVIQLLNNPLLQS